MFKIYPWYVQDISMICSRYVLHKSLICLRYVQDVSKICPRFVPEISRIYWRYLQDISKICSRYVQDLFKIHPRYIPDMSCICPRYVPYICPRYVSDMFQICLFPRERLNDFDISKGQSNISVSTALQPTDQLTKQSPKYRACPDFHRIGPRAASV